MELTGETEELREETHRVERQDVLTGIPESKVVIFKEEGVGPLRYMLEVAEVVPVEGALEQTLEKGLLALNDLLTAPPVGVIVEGLEVVEGARVLVEEVASEGGATPPGCQQEDLSGVLWGDYVSYSV